MTVLHARVDLYGQQVFYSIVQITIQYRCIFVLSLGRYSLQLDNNMEYSTFHLYFLDTDEKTQVARGLRNHHGEVKDKVD